MNIRTSLTALAFLAVIVVPNAALAEVSAPIEGNAITLADVAKLVQEVMNIGIVIATLAVVAMIVYAGFKMAVSRGNEADFKKAKDILKYAIYGAFVVFAVGLIVNTIANVAYDPTNVLY
ncbi:MAG: hypothetical protein AAB910_03620 [Patescibacteria group bacterium]